MNMKSSIQNRGGGHQNQSIRARPSATSRSAKRCAARFHAPAFAPLHRFINCLMAEASGRNGVNKKGDTMKTTIATLIALTVGLSALHAQPDTAPASGKQAGSTQRAKPAAPLVVATLDVNH